MICASKKCFLSGYFSSLLNQDGKKRYLEKISIIGGFDPYDMYIYINDIKWFGKMMF